MEVQYGNLGSVEINSRPGRGTKVTLQMPVLEAGAAAWPQRGREVLEAATHVMSDVMHKVDPDGRLSQALRSSTRR
jgi:two-component system LytT family sensor kinase